METRIVRHVTIPMMNMMNMMNARAAVPGRSLLLVTGDADLRAVVSRVLTGEGYGVIAAAHSGHALLAGLTNHIDILISELELDETSGPTLAETLRQHHPDLRAVYFGDAGTTAASGIIVRPFTRDDLMLTLHAGALATSAS